MDLCADRSVVCESCFTSEVLRFEGVSKTKNWICKTCRNVESTVFFLVPLKQVLLAITSVAIVQCVPSS